MAELPERRLPYDLNTNSTEGIFWRKNGDTFVEKNTLPTV